MSKQRKIYLVANYFAKPKNPKKTHVKGYMANPENVAWDESVIVTAGLKTKDLLSSRVVLNISEQKVEKNSFGTEKSFFELFEYFYNSSPKDISAALRRLGITVGKKDDPIPENVQTESQASAGPELASATNTVGASQSHQRCFTFY